MIVSVFWVQSPQIRNLFGTGSTAVPQIFRHSSVNEGRLQTWTESSCKLHCAAYLAYSDSVVHCVSLAFTEHIQQGLLGIVEAGNSRLPNASLVVVAQRAAELLRQSTSLDRSDEKTWLHWGLLERRRGNWQAARTCFKNGSELIPHNADIHQVCQALTPAVWLTPCDRFLLYEFCQAQSLALDPLFAIFLLACLLQSAHPKLCFLLWITIWSLPVGFCNLVASQNLKAGISLW